LEHGIFLEYRWLQLLRAASAIPVPKFFVRSRKVQMRAHYPYANTTEKKVLCDTRGRFLNGFPVKKRKKLQTGLKTVLAGALVSKH
jgi:hypothetical protein